MLKRIGVLLVFTCLCVTWPLQQKCSSAPAKSSKKVLPSTSQLIQKKPAEMYKFILEYQTENPWAVFGLTKGAPEKDINSAYNLISFQFRGRVMAKQNLSAEDMEFRKKIFTMLDQVRNKIIAPQPPAAKTHVTTPAALPITKTPLASPAQSQMPTPQTNNPFSKVPKAKKVAVLPTTKITPAIFYKKAQRAYDENNPWTIFGVEPGVDPALVQEIFERFTVWYAPEIINEDPDSTIKDKEIAHRLYDLLKQFRDMILNEGKQEYLKEERACVEPAQGTGFVDVIPILQNSPSQLYGLAQNVGPYEPWVVFNIEKNANEATINAAFHKLARKFSPYAIENNPDSTAEDKAIASELYQKLMELRKNMYTLASEREEKKRIAAYQKSAKERGGIRTPVHMVYHLPQNKLGYIQEVAVKPSDFLVTIEMHAAQNEPWEALGVEKNANKLTIDTAFTKLQNQFDPQKIKADPQLNILDRNAADKIVPLLTRMRDEMLLKRER